MSSELQKKMYEMEAIPPAQVWEKLSACLDEINVDAKFANKILEAELTPPGAVWENIRDSFTTKEKSTSERTGTVINLKRLAIAAIFIGVIVSAWFLFFKQGKEKNNLVTTNTPAVQEKINFSDNKETLPEVVNPETKTITSGIASLPATKNLKKRAANSYQLATVQIKHLMPPATTVIKNSVVISDEKPGDKVFDQPIDDLSMIAADSHYMTMVNANGRMVKIPVHLAHLAPRLQDKPITEDYYEILYGEGAFWKDKLNDWRQKLAASPIASGDIFSTMVELLKSMEAHKDNSAEQGK